LGSFVCTGKGSGIESDHALCFLLWKFGLMKGGVLL